MAPNVPGGRSPSRRATRVGSVQLTVVEAPALAARLAAALDGDAVLAPVPPRDARARAALRPEVDVTEPDAALVVTTSGSTGQPRAVVLSRAALRASALATHARLGGPGTWHCALATHHVAGLMTLVRAHVAGTEAVMVSTGLATLAPRPGRNYVSLVPTQLHRALADPGVTAALAGFDAVLVGGARLDAALAGRAAASGVPVVATYGMSETCGGCVYDGVPLDGVVVDAVGDRLRIGGPVLFSGYRLDPGGTAAVLRDGRLLTSDRGRWRDGRLEVTGRVDDVVISGGVNVDLAEAQHAADGVFGTPDAGGLVLLGVPDERWGTRIVAATTGAWASEEVRARLAGLLGPAALPREVRRVAALPRTRSGKIDVQALRRGWR